MLVRKRDILHVHPNFSCLFSASHNYYFFIENCIHEYYLFLDENNQNHLYNCSTEIFFHISKE